MASNVSGGLDVQALRDGVIARDQAHEIETIQSKVCALGHCVLHCLSLFLALSDGF